MIPLRLTLKNFMSYRDDMPPLDFGPVRTACLSGENGAGKSALLAAMTWALWGESPAHAADDDLIAQGESEMAVDFEFALGDQAYRVLRTRSRRGKSTSGKLTFQVRDPLGSWRDVSGDTVRQTQQAITGRLRMDYETFINSAFLRQGHADEFTTKNATERKDILARILGLDEYDRLAERAREQARTREGDRRVLMIRLSELDGRIARKPALEREAAEVAAYLQGARDTLATAGVEAERLRLLVAHLEKDRLALDNVRARAAQDEVEISKAERAIGALETNLIRYQETLAQRAEITARYGRLQQLRARAGELGDLARQSRELESEIHRLERAVDAARNVLANEIAMLKRSITEQGRLAATQADRDAQLQAVRIELAAFNTMYEEWKTAHQERDTVQQQIAEWQGANAKLKEEADGINAKLKLLDEALAEAEAERRRGQVPCPLCGILLDPPARDRVRADYTREVEARRGQYRANLRQVELSQKRIVALNGQIETLDEKLKARKMAEKREAALERDLQAAVEAQARLDKETANLQALEVRLELADYAVADRDALAAARARLAALAYDAEEHRRVDAEIRQLTPYETRYADLRSAQEQLESDTLSRERERENLEAHRRRLTAERAEETRLAAGVANLADLQRQAATQQAQLHAEQEHFNRLSGEQAAKERELEAIAADEVERAATAADLTRATAEKGIYDDLAKAFGKSGVQALVIEQVVPELAEDANRLLGRMTDNRMHLAFETQRQAKTRDSTIETLDIKITDGAGVARKYEMFSGGEAFRINFAVRIALSKLLARRAGAQLQTLIIDEGFGTQDAQGRERLVQAIRSIQEDFEKILVITHIDELKDEFATRIDVVKTARGSMAMVS